MARLREAISGAVLPSRIAASAALFQSVTTSAWARVPMRSAVEADHERSLKVFIKVNGWAAMLSHHFRAVDLINLDVADDPVSRSRKCRSDCRDWRTHAKLPQPGPIFGANF
jgi:hypothetical protein